jgi:hypothetical protein
VRLVGDDRDPALQQRHVLRPHLVLAVVRDDVAREARVRAGNEGLFGNCRSRCRNSASQWSIARDHDLELLDVALQNQVPDVPERSPAASRA